MAKFCTKCGSEMVDGKCPNCKEEKETAEKYVAREIPVAVRVVLSIVFSFAYFLVWFAGIIKKIKILAEEKPEYVTDVLLSLLVPFYFVYAIYKYAKKRNSNN